VLSSSDDLDSSQGSIVDCDWDSIVELNSTYVGPLGACSGLLVHS
jgi:hypothetical protein